MFEQIAAFLVSLAVAAAGLAGLDTASSAQQGVGTPEIAAARAAVAREEAAERLAGALEQAALASENSEELDVDTEHAGTGLETAATAIGEAPAAEAAAFGLSTALTAVTNAPTGDPETEDAGQPEDVPPVAPPTAPPADVPTGPPDAPGGRP